MDQIKKTILNSKFLLLLSLLTLTISVTGVIQSFADTMAEDLVGVSIENFARAETDNYMREYVELGALGQFLHYRELAPIDDQKVVRMNRDVLYSAAVLDLNEPATISMPDTGKRFQSLLIINQDHYVKLLKHSKGSYQLTQDEIGTRYAIALLRTYVNANSAEDLKMAQAAQDKVRIEQRSPGIFEIPNWNLKQLAAVRESLKKASNFLTDTTHCFGDVGQVDPVAHLLCTASGWGGNPAEGAMYIMGVPELNNGKVPHTLTLKNIPVNGFWSVSVYNKDGFFEQNEYNSYVINEFNSVKNEDGSITIRFGGDPSQPNFLFTPEGWNYIIRLYLPRKQLLSGSWVAPKAIPVQ